VLMHRAEVVAQVARLKAADATPPLRPGREAQILRRIVARHRGGFPKPVLVRLWRELLSGTTAMQAALQVAVFAPLPASGFWDLARDHFGSQTAMTGLRTTGEVVSAVIDGRASLGVLPVPGQRDGDSWWRLLMTSDSAKPHVIARLPFGARGATRGEDGDALVIARMEPEPSGADRSLYIIETDQGLSRTRIITALADAGLRATRLAGTEPGGARDAQLVEFDEWVLQDDPRLKEGLLALGGKLLGVASLGFYARPLTEAELSGAGP
jgi:chorismate mutase/prephenate dehydratase